MGVGPPPPLRGRAFDLPPGHERAEHGPGVIESALQAEGPTPERRGRHIRDQRVARRRAQPLPEAVHDPPADDPPPRRGGSDHPPHPPPDRLTPPDQPAPAPPPGRPPPRPPPHQTRRGD